MAIALRTIEDEVHQQVVAQARGDDAPPGAAEVGRLVRAAAPLLPTAQADTVVDRVLARTGGLGAVQPLLTDPDVTEVMINGPGPVWVERHGTLHRTEIEFDTPAIELLATRIVSPLGLRVDRSSPMVDARLGDGSRVNVVVPPLAVDGPCITIRRFGARAIPLAAIAPPGVAELLRWAVAGRSNLLISGGTGAGKTTLLNALAATIDHGERIVTIEDAAELRLPGEHTVRLEARPPDVEGLGAITIRDLVRNALRMRPDRLIVGEVRGPEALDLLQAMNTGHEGSLSTCHANGPDDALRRIETMVLTGAVALPLVAVREQVRSALDLVVHVARAPSGERAVSAVAEVVPAGDGDPGSAGPVVTRPLADASGLRSLPLRPLRRAGMPPPDAAWLVDP